MWRDNCPETTHAHAIGEQGAYLAAVLSGHFGYYGVPINGAALTSFHGEVGRMWGRTLATAESEAAALAPPAAPHPILVPPVRICHPHPLQVAE
jgi:hypothetical protein